MRNCVKFSISSSFWCWFMVKNFYINETYVYRKKLKASLFFALYKSATDFISVLNFLKRNKWVPIQNEWFWECVRASFRNWSVIVWNREPTVRHTRTHEMRIKCDMNVVFFCLLAHFTNHIIYGMAWRE